MAEKVLVVIRTMRQRVSLCVGCLETCSSSLGKRGWQHRCIAFLVVLFEYRDMISRVKIQSLAFTGCT